MDILIVYIPRLIRLTDTGQWLTWSQYLAVHLDLQPVCLPEIRLDRLNYTKYHRKQTIHDSHVRLCFRPEHMAVHVCIIQTERKIHRICKRYTITITQMSLIIDLLWNVSQSNTEG